MAIRDLLPIRRESQPMASTVATLQREMNRIFDQIWGDGRMSLIPQMMREELAMFQPRIDVREEENRVEVTAELPGMTEQDVDITLSPDGTQLMIRGEKKMERERKEKDYYRAERTYGSFRRAIPLPAAADTEQDIQATMKNGVLTMSLPKAAEERAGVKHIKIQSS